MIKRVEFCLLRTMICLLLAGLPAVADASDWAYVGKGSNPKILGSYDAFVDRETVLRSGDCVIFWELQVYNDVADGIVNERSLHRVEAVDSFPRRWRELECYQYDADGKVAWHDAAQRDFSEHVPLLYDQEIGLALTVAKLGVDNGHPPALP